MSWLLAVFVPGLLMLAPFGLGRVEARLQAGGQDSDPIGELLANAVPEPAATHRAPSALTADATVRLSFTGLATLCEEPGLPTRLFGCESANRQFPQTRHANSV